MPIDSCKYLLCAGLLFVPSSARADASPSFAVSPASLTFTAGDPPQTVTVNGTGAPNWSASVTPPAGGAWLIITEPSSGPVGGSFQVSIANGGLATGTYSGSIAVSVPGIGVQNIDVTFIVPPPPPPTVLEGGVVNAASFRGSAGVAPGEIVTLFGRGLGPDVGAAAPAISQTGFLPTSLAGVSVTVNGAPAPLFFVRQDQISLQMPYDLGAQNSAELQVQFNGMQSQPFVVPVVSAAPGIFTLHPTGGQAAALNQDSSPNSVFNPAKAGSVVQLFLTGQGKLKATAVAGQPSPVSGPFPAPLQTVSASIGGIDARVTFAGMAPGLTGVLQVNVQVPDSFFPLENVPVIVTVGGAQSAGNVTIAVQ